MMIVAIVKLQCSTEVHVFASFGPTPGVLTWLGIYPPVSSQHDVTSPSSPQCAVPTGTIAAPHLTTASPNLTCKRVESNGEWSCRAPLLRLILIRSEVAKGLGYGI